MARRKRREGIGDSAEHHASSASSSVSYAKQALESAAKAKSCKLRFDHVQSAINKIAKAWAHAFGSGGRVHKGALTARTVPEDVAKRIYDVDADVTRATEAFRRDCVKES